MKIECQLTGITPKAPLLSFFSRVLEYARGRVSLDQSAIGRVIVATEDRYGAAIESVRSGSGYTNHDAAVGVGKTIPRMSDGKVTSDIIFRECVFTGLWEVYLISA